MNENPFGQKDFGLFSLWKTGERSELLAKFLQMYEYLKIAGMSWFAPVGSAHDYPVLSNWVIYGEVELLFAVLDLYDLVLIQHYLVSVFRLVFR